MLKGVWQALAIGLQVHSGDPSLDTLLSRGGMESMLDTIWLIIVALAFGSVLQACRHVGAGGGAGGRARAHHLSWSRPWWRAHRPAMCGGRSVYRHRFAWPNVQGASSHAAVCGPVLLSRSWRQRHCDVAAGPGTAAAPSWPRPWASRHSPICRSPSSTCSIRWPRSSRPQSSARGMAPPQPHACSGHRLSWRGSSRLSGGGVSDRARRDSLAAWRAWRVPR